MAPHFPVSASALKSVAGECVFQFQTVRAWRPPISASAILKSRVNFSTGTVGYTESQLFLDFLPPICKSAWLILILFPCPRQTDEEDMFRPLQFTETALPYTMDRPLSVSLVDATTEDGKTREHPRVELQLGPEDIFTTACHRAPVQANACQVVRDESSRCRRRVAEARGRAAERRRSQVVRAISSVLLNDGRQQILWI
ncbi:hypothetical protein F5888DRAFT_1724441 [Russula emetica]|nr:hypothetical protein F5888DRAFT_1724441 [Russula emetica]